MIDVPHLRLQYDLAMAIFVIFRVSDPPKMLEKLREVYPNDHLQVQQGEFLVSASGTAKDVAERLGITGTTTPTVAAIVFSMASYFGRASTEIWDWIKTKAEQTGG